MAQNTTTEASMSALHTVSLTEAQIDLALVAFEARRIQLHKQADTLGNEDIAFTLLDMADEVEALRRDLLRQVSQPTVAEIEAEIAQEDADREAEAEAEYYAEVIAPMEYAERQAQAACDRDEARYGRDEF